MVKIKTVGDKLFPPAIFDMIYRWVFSAIHTSTGMCLTEDAVRRLNEWMNVHAVPFDEKLVLCKQTGMFCMVEPKIVLCSILWDK